MCLPRNFTKTRFQSSFDADEEQEILAKKVKEQLKKRRCVPFAQSSARDHFV